MATSKGDDNPQRVAAKPPAPTTPSNSEADQIEDFLKMAYQRYEKDPGLFNDPSGFPKTYLAPRYANQNPAQEQTPQPSTVDPRVVMDNPVDTMKFLSDKIGQFDAPTLTKYLENAYGNRAELIGNKEPIGEPTGPRILINRPLPSPNNGSLINEPLPTPSGPRIVINRPPPGPSGPRILINTPAPGSQTNTLMDRNLGAVGNISAISKADFTRMMLGLIAHQQAVARGLHPNALAA